MVNVLSAAETLQRATELSGKMVTVKDAAAHFYRNQIWLRSKPNDDDPADCILLAPDHPETIKYLMPLFMSYKGGRVPLSAAFESVLVAGILRPCSVDGFKFAIEELQWTEEFYAERRRPQLEWVDGKYRELTELPYEVDEAYTKPHSLLSTHPDLESDRTVDVGQVLASREQFHGRPIKLSGFLIVRDSDLGRGPSTMVSAFEDANDRSRSIEVDQPNLSYLPRSGGTYNLPKLPPHKVELAVISGSLTPSAPFAATLTDVTEICLSGSLDRKWYRCVKRSRLP